MDIIRSSYKILFNLELELTGNSNDLNQYINVIPDESTLELYPVYKILPRYQKNSSVVLVEVIADGINKDKLRIMLKNNEVFRFQVKFTDSGFRSATNLSDYDLDANVILLTNTVNHTAGSTLLLSAPVESYNAANEYKKGYVVQSTGSFYKAIKESSNADPHGVGETDFWKSVTDGGTYVSQADLRDRASLTAQVDLDTVILIEIIHSSTLNAAYQLIDGTSKCREVSYKIKLLTGN